MTCRAILWRRLDKPGHDAARLSSEAPNWCLAGTAVFSHGQQPCCLGYEVVCSKHWETLSVKVEGWIGFETVRIDIAVDPDHRWSLNGTECPQVSGCIDVDLSFSPSTNLLPIRRLGLPVGQRAASCAAWIAFPSLRIERLEQAYHRLDVATYHYESAGGEFVAELSVNAEGFVTFYPNFWQLEAQ